MVSVQWFSLNLKICCLRINLILKETEREVVHEWRNNYDGQRLLSSIYTRIEFNPSFEDRALWRR